MPGNALEGGGHCHSRNQITPSQKSRCPLCAMQHVNRCAYGGAQSRDVYVECSSSTRVTSHTRFYVPVAQLFEVEWPRVPGWDEQRLKGHNASVK